MSVKVSNRELWKLLIGKDMNKTDLRNATGMSMFTVAKMACVEDVTMPVTIRICKVLDCDIGDIIEPKRTDVN